MSGVRWRGEIRMIYQDMNEFMEWYRSLNINEEVDLHEANTIFFNQEIYEEVI